VVSERDEVMETNDCSMPSCPARPPRSRYSPSAHPKNLLPASHVFIGVLNPDLEQFPYLSLVLNLFSLLDIITQAVAGQMQLEGEFINKTLYDLHQVFAGVGTFPRERE